MDGLGLGVVEMGRQVRWGGWGWIRLKWDGAGVG